MTESNSYRSIFKAISLFGGAQLFTIILTLIRSKFVALQLGAEGFGLNTLLLNPLNLIVSLCGLGISYSALKELSYFYDKRDASKFELYYNVYIKLIKYTAFFSFVVLLILSPFLSYWSFNSFDKFWIFCLLALSAYSLSYYNGYLSVFRAIRQIALSAKLSSISPLISLLVSLPLILIYNQDGILYSIVISSIISTCIIYLYIRRQNINRIYIDRKQIFTLGTNMIKLGFVMTIAGVLSQTVNYLLVLFVQENSGIDAVGKYNAGLSMTNQYIGLVFTALAADYFPRLSIVRNDNSSLSHIANQQAEILIYITVPFIMFFNIVTPLFIKILFSDEFIDITLFVRLLSIGMFFKAISWVLSIIPSVKGDIRDFFILEFFSALIYLLLSVFGYTYYGLTGMAFGFIITFLGYYILMAFYCKSKYAIKFNPRVYLLIFLSILTLSVFLYVNIWIADCYLLLISVFLLSSIYCITNLYKRLK